MARPKSPTSGSTAKPAQRPCERFRPDCLRPLSGLSFPTIATRSRPSCIKIFACSSMATATVRPTALVGQPPYPQGRCPVRSTLYHRTQEIVSYPRCWRRGQTLGADRFEEELADLRPQPSGRRHSNVLCGSAGLCCAKQCWKPICATSGRLAIAHSPARLTELLQLIRQYGPEAVAAAIAESLPRPAHSEPITWPTSCGSSSPRAILNPLCTPRSRTEPTGHRSLVAVGLRRFHS